MYSPPVEPGAHLTDKPGKSGESKVEVAKRQGRYLRGTIAETLASEATHFGHDDIQLLKFHGSYQQDDRDQRRGRGEDEEKAWSFMIRVAIPAGLVTADQYLALDRLADEYANGTLRVTTRQGIQYHGVLKGSLKPAIAGINRALLSTIAACGDVERNVMGCPAPLDDPGHTAVREAARAIARDLRPASRAYHEIWLDGEKIASSEPEEPFYGDRYLPRKFKTGVALDTDNCVDVHSQDAGLVAITLNGALLGFNLLAGGGLGITHNKGDTTARLAQVVAFVKPPHAVAAVRTVAAIFRDHGNRADRRHARLKYLIAEWGIERFREEFRRRADFPVAEPIRLPAPVFHDHLGRHGQPDGRWFYGVFVQNGRVKDEGDFRLRTALREIVAAERPGVILTPGQNLLLTDLTREALRRVESALRAHGVAPAEELSAVRRYSMACPALPTCGLAVAEAERALPGLLDQLESELTRLGMRDAPLTVRMTGCPNGCARPYTADISFVGRSADLYHVYVGGSLAGNRLADLYQNDVPTGEIVPALRPLLERWAVDRRANEGLGDYYQRALGPRAPREALTGREDPTAALLQLETSR